jgi:glycosyltransferase involved in cell wall biosynthesis
VRGRTSAPCGCRAHASGPSARLGAQQSQHKTCHAILVGGDGVSYGRRPKDAANWRERLLREVNLDPTRTHFLGKVSYEIYVKILQVSAAHVYWTYPFVLSWSLLEAAACKTPIVASNTSPVQELLCDERDRLIDFFDSRLLSLRIEEVLVNGQNAERSDDLRALVNERYSHQSGILGYDAVLTRRSGHALQSLRPLARQKCVTQPATV